jgi:hypothetical protein
VTKDNNKERESKVKEIIIIAIHDNSLSEGNSF